MGWKLFGDDYLTVNIKTADKAGLLMAVHKAGISFYDTVSKDDLVICAKIQRRNFSRLSAILQDRCEEMKIKERSGTYWRLVSLKVRPILLFGFIMITLLSVILPMHVLFVSVEGNSVVPTNLVVEEAANAGLAFGTLRHTIRSEQIKNHLLSSIPDLQWAGVNTYGCMAVISVEEKSYTGKKQDTPNIASIVASRDGIIQSITATQGNVLCSIGQAVYKDQVLVSGYTDCGLVIKATCAEAEIIAQTFHKKSAISPGNILKRTALKESSERFSLRIGKKLIKLYKDSGISDARYDKISKEYPLQLPGGFLLPIALIKEERNSFLISEELSHNAGNLKWLYMQLDNSLLSQMIAGEVVRKNYTTDTLDDVVLISAEYICRENIGLTRTEERSLYE